MNRGLDKALDDRGQSDYNAHDDAVLSPIPSLRLSLSLASILAPGDVPEVWFVPQSIVGARLPLPGLWGVPNPSSWR